ncbi:hypothetical protein [Alicyclobacillus mali (ex Roth et al. 2021)]|uniref:hypothetical protein n=1 Tax=Alicyclobacillus mali (ex Roth et al. 2021) TaxID=1123961 RepID=UPI001E3F16D7|nr:hypothetical protein [Alicyclobacillus mali (ex Roth et al. 2021)]
MQLAVQGRRGEDALARVAVQGAGVKGGIGEIRRGRGKARAEHHDGVTRGARGRRVSAFERDEQPIADGLGARGGEGQRYRGERDGEAAAMAGE